MCGRFSLAATAEQLADYYHLVSVTQYQGPRFNIAPSQNIAAIVAVNGERHLEYFHWGLIPSWAKNRSSSYKMINARVETVDNKPAFRHAFMHHRCVIPADGFYEWHGKAGHKQAWRIEPKASASFLSFAGIWETWLGEGEVLRSCAIIVGEANALLKPVHDRMPIMLPRKSISRWLNPDTGKESLGELLNSAGSEALTVFRVSDYVNSPEHESPACVVPLEASS